jgi:hypothetical protein
MPELSKILCSCQVFNLTPSCQSRRQLHIPGGWGYVLPVKSRMNILQKMCPGSSFINKKDDWAIHNHLTAIQWPRTHHPLHYTTPSTAAPKLGGAVTGTVEIHACLFDVELATQSMSLFLTNQINRNLVHLKRPYNCTHFSAYTLHTQRD